MASFHLLDPDSDGYGPACEAAAGFSELAGVRGGAGVFRVCAAGSWIYAVSYLAVPTPCGARIRGGACRRIVGCGVWKFSAVGAGGAVPGHSRAGRHGDG